MGSGSLNSSPFKKIHVPNKNGTTCYGKILRTSKKPFQRRKLFSKKRSVAKIFVKKTTLTKEEKIRKYTTRLEIYIQMLPIPTSKILFCIERLSKLTRKKRILVVEDLEVESEVRDKIRSFI